VADEPRDVTRQQFERAAQLAEEGGEYADRWSRIHEEIAEAAARREVGDVN
jgi:hypothetical protein